MKQANNSYWDKEDFEDLVAKSLIAMYETKIKNMRYIPKFTKLKPEHIYSMRALGCLFLPDDRICVLRQENDSPYQEFDIKIDGLPSRAVFCNAISESERARYSPDMFNATAYLNIHYLQKIDSFPSRILSDEKGSRYRLTNIFYNVNGVVEGSNHFVVIRNDGAIFNTYHVDQMTNPLTGHTTFAKVIGGLTLDQHIITNTASATIQYYQDRRYLWNVKATEGIAKATFGVYPEQIKSLFYARELPQTNSGRKRPILHWVRAHQRRMKEGIEIDIDKHLRGCDEFVMNNTKFKIINPRKKNET